MSASLLAALPPDLRQEWALRMWCAKEAVGKALGRGLSAGLLAFHITRADIASGDHRSGVARWRARRTSRNCAASP